MRRTTIALSGLLAAAVAVTPLLAAPAPAGTTSGASSPSAAAGVLTPRAAAPTLRVTRLARGLSTPWDAQQIDRGGFLVTERSSKRLLLLRGTTQRRISFPSTSVWASGETGLMGLEIDPDFNDNGRFYTCQGGYRTGGGHDVRVVAWRLNDAQTAATFQRTLVSGLPATSGRHGGCRLLITRRGALLIGTGDAAVGTNPRNPRSLGGKVLRVYRSTGLPWPENRWYRSQHRNPRYVYTWGHRNVQGLAQRSDGSLWSVEHGPDRDDEVNVLTNGGDYGWNPVPGYDESRPMTDYALPGPQVAARWRSGSPTLATSGATWIRGSRWGSLDGTLAVAALKGERVSFMRFDSQRRLVGVQTPAALRGYGRLRSVHMLVTGNLVVTTSNGSDDSVLIVKPG